MRAEEAKKDGCKTIILLRDRQVETLTPCPGQTYARFPDQHSGSHSRPRFDLLYIFFMFSFRSFGFLQYRIANTIQYRLLLFFINNIHTFIIMIWARDDEHRVRDVLMFFFFIYSYTTRTTTRPRARLCDNLFEYNNNYCLRETRRRCRTARGRSNLG